MWAKLLAGVAVVLAFGLAAYLGQHVIRAYGEARYAAGRADARAAQIPAMLAANAAIAKAALDARARLIAADTGHAATIAHLLPLIMSSNNEVKAYAANDAGRSACLDADRVRGVQASRAALFSAGDISPATTRPIRSMPADGALNVVGRLLK